MRESRANNGCGSASHGSGSTSITAAPHDSDEQVNSTGTSGDARSGSVQMVERNSPEYTITTSALAQPRAFTASTAPRPSPSTRRLHARSAATAAMNATSAHAPTDSTLPAGFANTSSASSGRPRSSMRHAAPTATMPHETTSDGKATRPSERLSAADERARQEQVDDDERAEHRAAATASRTRGF